MKKIKPTASNRDLTVLELKNESIARGLTKLSTFKKEQVWWDKASNDWEYCCAASLSFYNGIEIALMNYLNGNKAHANEWLSMSLTYGQRFALLNSTMVNFELQNRDDPDFSTAIEDQRLPMVIGLLAASGQHHSAAILCQFWHKLLQNPVFIEMFIGIDPGFIAFQRQLMQAFFTKEWPDIKEQDVIWKELGGFGSLFKVKPDDADFVRHLDEYLDFRIANTFGYDSVSAEKRRPGSRSFPSSVFNGSTGFMLIPYELFIYAWVWEQTSGKTFVWPTSHPFLMHAWIDLPEVKQLIIDSNVKKFDDFSGAKLGAEWQRLAYGS
jgi:hypothetical protein